MAHATTSHAHAHDGRDGHDRPITYTFHAAFACLECARAAERALRAVPHVTDVHVDYEHQTVHVGVHGGMVEPTALQQSISDSAHGCRCTVDDAADRMQYEFPSTAAGKAHDAGHDGHVGHALAGHAGYASATGSAPAAGHAHHPSPAGAHVDHVVAASGPDHGGHAGMGHDMSDPRMAKAMEADMKRRIIAFCAPSCKKQFLADPEAYLAG